MLLVLVDVVEAQEVEAHLPVLLDPAHLAALLHPPSLLRTATKARVGVVMGVGRAFVRVGRGVGWVDAWEIDRLGKWEWGGLGWVEWVGGLREPLYLPPLPLFVLGLALAFAIVRCACVSVYPPRGSSRCLVRIANRWHYRLSPPLLPPLLLHQATAAPLPPRAPPSLALQ